MKQQRPFILFITGISTAGKTTAYENLKKDPELTEIKFHDVDETGIPQAGKGAWRVYKSEEYLHTAKQDYKKGISTVLAGIIPPHEVIEYKTYDKALNVHFILLNINADIFKKRMDVRLKNQSQKQDYLEHYHSNLKLATTLENQIANQKNGHLIEAADLNKNQVCQKIKAIIKKIAIVQ